jgi:hypothetical protein
MRNEMKQPNGAQLINGICPVCHRDYSGDGDYPFCTADDCPSYGERALNDAERDYELFKRCGFNPVTFRNVKNGIVKLRNDVNFDSLLNGDADNIEAHGMGVSLEF